MLLLLPGVDVALPGDYCTTPDNKPDPNVVCSVAAPICNAGYSGKCEAVPAADTEAITSGPSEWRVLPGVLLLTGHCLTTAAATPGSQPA